MMRIYRNTVHQTTYQKQSPLHEIEPTFVEFIIRVSETGIPLSVAESLLFINSVIHNTVHQKKLIAFKRHHFSQDYLSSKTDAELGTVGRNYWGSFYKRNKDKLATQRAKKFEMNRKNWTKYRFFQQMFDSVYNVMIDAGLAKKLRHPIWMDKEGKPVLDEVDGFGFKIDIDLIHPDCVLVLDEAGADNSMVQDGAFAGRKFVGARNEEVRYNVTKKSKRYTVIPILSLSGEAVMCVVIIDGTDRSAFLEAGIDVFNLDSDTCFDDISMEDFSSNFGPGKLFPGGPLRPT